MTNEEYQQHAREQRRRNDEEAHRRSLADYARSQQELRDKQKRDHDRAAKRISEQAGYDNGIPILGFHDQGAYEQGRARREGMDQLMGSFAKPRDLPRRASGPSASSSHILSNTGLLIATLLVGGVVWMLSQGSPSNSGHYTQNPPSTTSTPVEPSAIAKPSASVPVPENTQVGQDSSGKSSAATSSDTNPSGNSPVVNPQSASPAETSAIEVPRSTQPDMTTPFEPASSPAVTNGPVGYSVVPAEFGYNSTTKVFHYDRSPLPLEGLRYRATHRSFLHGCDGDLILTGSGLSFTCQADMSKAFSFSLAEIEGPNGDGIQMRTGKKYHGKKYHFYVVGVRNDLLPAFFAEWFYRALANQSNR